MKLTESQIHILSHALGHEKRYRNHYAVDQRSEPYFDLEIMEGAGLVARHKHDPGYTGLVMFHATDLGIAALDKALIGDAPTLSDKNFAIVLKFMRNKAGITQHELAKKLGMKDQMIDQYEGLKNPRIPKVENLVKIFSVLGYELKIVKRELAE